MNPSPFPPSWPDHVFRSLLPNAHWSYTAVDLYCGAGGFSLGFAALGFRITGFDSDKDSVATFSANVGEAQSVDLHTQVPLPKADVLIAGPPCQPWSRAGKRRGEMDARDGFPSIIRAIEVVEPSIVVIENVADIALKHRRSRLDDIMAELVSGGFIINETILNASDYGVPQNRRRAFVFGVRDNKTLPLPTPLSAHVPARAAISGTSLLVPKNARFLTEDMDKYVARYEKASGCRVPRDLHLDRPARTLTVRNLAGATGDMMRLSLPCGRRRMLTIREAARLQSFPDWFRFVGSPQSQFSQIGNAVPPLLSLAVAKMVHRRLSTLMESDQCA